MPLVERAGMQETSDRSKPSFRAQAGIQDFSLQHTRSNVHRNGSRRLRAKGKRLIGVSLDSSAARPLPSRIHDVEYLVVSVQRVEPPGRELRAADSPAKRDHRLIDDHGLAVHRRMPG